MYQEYIADTGEDGPEADEFIFYILDPDNKAVDLELNGIIDQKGKYRFGIFDNEAIKIEIDSMIDDGYEVEDTLDIGLDHY